MSNEKTSAILQLERVADLVFLDLLETSDADILQEALEDGIDIEQEIKRVQWIISEANLNSGKARLNEAKKAFLVRKSAAKQSLFHSLSLQQKKNIIGHLKNSTQLKKKITLAARSENELSEKDLNAYLQSLYDLKVIDEKGKALCD